MAAISTHLIPPQSTKLRTFDARRDLKVVADLVEMCFADSLDPDGRRYLRQMRRAATAKRFNQLAKIFSPQIPLALSGYVWEEDGQIIGNLSTIPIFKWGQRIFMIANVAVHPDYRRRGIARTMTIKALDHLSRHRRAEQIWLQVREQNAIAYELYTSMGFKERARRQTWLLKPRTKIKSLISEIEVIPLTTNHWSLQNRWLKLNYPAELLWHLTLKLKTLKPGLLGELYRVFTDTHIRQLSAVKGNRLQGTLTWQSSHTYADHLWLAAPLESENLALRSLVPKLLHANSSNRPMTLEYPYRRATQAFETSGFHLHTTLIWMALKS